MSKVLNGLRVSAMSVHEGWWYGYLIAFFIQIAGWTFMIALDEAAYGGHTRTIEYLRAVGTGSSHMTQIFILSAIGAVESGRLIMILAQGIADRMKQRREKFKEELIAQGKAEGISEGMAKGIAEGRTRGVAEGMAEGLAEGKVQGKTQGKAEGLVEGIAQGRTVGRAELAAEIAAWNQRRLDAEAHGEKFDEPHPMS